MKTLIQASQIASESCLQGKVEKIFNTNNQHEIFNLCVKFTKELDASYFTYTLFLPNNFHHLEYKQISNLHTNWTDRYKEQSYVFVDPNIRECMETFSPVFWNTQINKAKKLNVNSRIVVEDAYKYGLRAGNMVPVFDYRGINGVFELGLAANSCSRQSQKNLQLITPYASYFGGAVHQSMINLIKQKEIVQQELLTKREKNCLCLAADGKTATEIGSILCISENTVKFHSKNIKKKLGARNTVQALAISILKGDIMPGRDN
jgi:DNA-binding CsgD family transcriptional regulator